MQSQNSLDKYFWDHTQKASDTFKLIRLFEYANFPDLLKIPFDDIKKNIEKIDIKKLRTSKLRIEFLIRVKKNIDQCKSWEDIVTKISL